MRVRIPLLTLLFVSTFSGLAVAGPATRLLINCLPSRVFPPGTHCFDEELGKPFRFYVIALDAQSFLATDYTGTVHITSNDPTATLPADYTFAISDGGIAGFTATFHSLTTASVPSLETISVTDIAGNLSAIGAFYVFPQHKPVPATLSPWALVMLAGALIASALATFFRRCGYTALADFAPSAGCDVDRRPLPGSEPRQFTLK